MKKLIFAISISCLISACTTTEYIEIEKECPACVPPAPQFQVVTECSEFQETSLNARTYAQCRYCTNKIYSNGVDVTDRFITKEQKQPKKNPCRK